MKDRLLSNYIPGKIDQLFGYGQKFLAERIEFKIHTNSSIKTQPTIPIPILANYLASVVISQLKWWLDNEMPYSPEQMDKIFHRLLLLGINSVMNEARGCQIFSNLRIKK